MMTSKYPLYTEGVLAPQADALIEQIIAAGEPPMVALTPEQNRAQPSPAAWHGERIGSVRIERAAVPGPAGSVPIRLYTPEGDGVFPILLFFHGGGFVSGSLDELEPFCTMIASGAHCIVVSVDYRLAPEHKYPAAVEDAAAALQWVAAHAPDFRGDPDRIAVAGDSAGGNLAAVVSLIAREQGFPRLVFQVLICAWVDSSSFETESFRLFGDGLWLSKAAMCWFRDHYLNAPEEALHPHVSPLLADDLRLLPPALVITAEFDVLRDQAEAYARRLQEAGVQVHCTRYPGMLHDFVVHPGIFDMGFAAIGEMTTTLHKAFTSRA